MGMQQDGRLDLAGMGEQVIHMPSCSCRLFVWWPIGVAEPK